MNAEGWYYDPFGVHELRWFSAGSPTGLVRDGTLESTDEPPVEPAWAPVMEQQLEEPPAAAAASMGVLGPYSQITAPPRSWAERRRSFVRHLVLPCLLIPLVALGGAELLGAGHPVTVAGIALLFALVIGLRWLAGDVSSRDHQAARDADWSGDLYPR